MIESPPIVLVFAGSDPTGGAGIQADIETIASLGCRAAPVITAVTVQDTHGVKEFTAVEPALVIAQARAVLADMPVAAFKIGMIGSAVNASAIASIVQDHLDIPLVVDPVLTSGRGDALGDDALADSLRTLLFPQATLITPNSVEARRLASAGDTLDACAQELLATGCEYVLITGTHEDTPAVENRLYGNLRLLESFTWERLPGGFHGSGCTLAAACAATLAHGFEMVNAVHEAQEFTWNSLKQGLRMGQGQTLPDRFYWTRDNGDDGA